MVESARHLIAYKLKSQLYDHIRLYYSFHYPYLPATGETEGALKASNSVEHILKVSLLSTSSRFWVSSSRIFLSINTCDTNIAFRGISQKIFHS